MPFFFSQPFLDSIEDYFVGCLDRPFTLWVTDRTEFLLDSKMMQELSEIILHKLGVIV